MLYENITCPHCGLLCDDLSIESDGRFLLEVKSSLPDQCRNAMSTARVAAQTSLDPVVAGHNVAMEDAIHMATDIIEQAQQVLISGLVADVGAVRGALALADQIGAIIDHGSSKGLFDNIATMQRYGMIATTLAEVRNRADCIVILGSNTLAGFPRFLPRITCPKTTLSPNLQRSLFVIDSNRCNSSDDELLNEAQQIYADVESLDSAVELLTYALNDKRDAAIERLESLTSVLEPVVKAIRQSQYCVFVWSAAEFESQAAQTTIQNLSACIKRLSESIRCTGLPLGGSKGQITANQVCTWQTGLPLRTRFIDHAPEHNQELYATTSLLEQHHVDVLLWISLFDPSDVPPATDAKTIVIGHPNMRFENPVDVFIPAAIPGVDTTGLACRTDNVATLPLQQMRDIGLLQATTIITYVQDALRKRTAGSLDKIS